MEDNDFIAKLKRDEHKLQAEITAKQQDLDAIRRVILLYAGKPEQPLEIGSPGEQSSGPLEAVRSLFDEAPAKRWGPPEIKGRLEKLREENKLASSAKNLFGAVHTAIASLERSGYIRKHESANGKSAPTYSKKVLQSESASITG